MENEKRALILLKSLLIIQSFFPLALLLLIQYGDLVVFELLKKARMQFANNPSETIIKIICHPDFCLALLHFFCVALIVGSIIIYVLFSKIQSYGFIDRAEKVKINADTTEAGVSFFVTYIIPMLMDEINEPRGFLCFIIIFMTLVLLMVNTNLYYQNPMLVIMGYKTFRFSFKNTSNQAVSEKEYIAITRGRFDENKIVRYKSIGDDIYLVFNKN